MIWLSSSTLSRLRNQLLERGAPRSVMPSVSADLAEMSAEQALATAQLVSLEHELGALCEAMLLMMRADGSVSRVERDVLRGAIRELAESPVRSHQLDALLERAEARIERDGAAARLQAVASELRGDDARAEVAFVLAAAIAFADNLIADNENDTLNAFAEQLGLDEERANTLLDQLDGELVKRDAR